MNGNYGVNTETALVDIELIDVIDQPMPEQSEIIRSKLKSSIEEHGILDPIHVRGMENGRYAVIEGRTRLGIAKELGHKRIKCNSITDVDNPLSYKILSYELELFRRHLSATDQERLAKELDKVKLSSDSVLRDGLARKLSPEMRAKYNDMNEKKLITKDWRLLFLLIARLPYSEQKAFFDSKTMISQSDAEKESAELIDSLNDKIDELNKRNETLEVAQSTLNKIKDDYDKRIKEAISKKMQELEETYKEENLVGGKLEALLEKERRKIEAAAEADMKDTLTKLQEVSKAKDKTQQLLDATKERLTAEEGNRKEAETFLKKKSDEVIRHKNLIKTLTNSPKITEHLQITLNDITSVYESLTFMGDTVMDDKQKEEIDNKLSKILDYVDLIKGVINKPKLKKTATG
jgi:ParB family chromosome partitioning protein